MKSRLLFFLILFTTISYAQNTFRLWHFNAKDGAEAAIGELMTKHNENAKFKSGGIQIERISYGDNIWTHRVVAFGEVGKIGRSDLQEFQQELFLERLNNYVEEWGPSYAGRFLSYVGGQPKDFPFVQIYDLELKDPDAFKKAHDKFVSKASKIIGDRPIGFGTYDIGSPGGATHWVVIGSSGFSDLINQKQQWEDNLSKEAAEWAQTNGGVEFKSNFIIQVLAAFGSL